MTENNKNLDETVEVQFDGKKLLTGEKTATLIVISGYELGKEYILDNDKVIGRIPSCDIRINSTKVSRRHAKLVKKGKNFNVIDLNSTNGTYVNGKRIIEAPLSDGDKLHLGEIIFKYILRDKIDTEYHHIIYDRATFDGLTGLYNRRCFMENLAESIKHSRLVNEALSLIMFDIDHFKKVNDTYGHLAGDTVLKGVSNIFNISVRKSDIAARYGGEEFIAILKNTEKNEAYKLAERIRKKIEKTIINHNEIKLR